MDQHCARIQSRCAPRMHDNHKASLIGPREIVGLCLQMTSQPPGKMHKRRSHWWDAGKCQVNLLS